MSTESHSHIIPDYSVPNIYKDEYNIGYSLLIDKVIPFDFDLLVMDDADQTMAKLKVHRTVLQVSSGYFSSLLASNMAETTSNSCKVRVPGLTVEEQCKTLPRAIETLYSLQSNKPETLQDFACHLMMLDYFDFKGLAPFFKSFKFEKSDVIAPWIHDMVINQLKGSSTDEAIQSASQALYSIVTVLDNMMNSRKLLSPIPSYSLETMSKFRYNLFNNVVTMLIIVWMAGIECLTALKPILGATHRFCDSVLSVWSLDYEPNISHIANCLVTDSNGLLKHAIDRTLRKNMESWGLTKPFCNEIWTFAHRTAVNTYSTMQTIADGDKSSSKTKKTVSWDAVANNKLQALKSTISFDNGSGNEAFAFYGSGKIYTKMMEVIASEQPVSPKKQSK
uniref:BTB/POZ domain-containing protein KLHL-like n=1 Tax=Clandestinovirus TaxID=2831644 RepID=A0A8F8KPQ9_9VIRU|nr:BTB/POZ domain-containing protein KLHL-like [Clandestinovirus]